MSACLQEDRSRDKPLNRFVRELGHRVLKRFPLLDCGGCAVYAAVLGEQLKAAGAEDVGVWVLALEGEESDVDIDTVRRQIRNTSSIRAWQRKGVQFIHVGIEYTWENETWHVDNKRLVPIEFGQDLTGFVYSGRLTLEEIRGLAAQPKGWNTMFNREQIPAVQAFVQNAFAEFREQNPSSGVSNESGQSNIGIERLRALERAHSPGA